jgi:hypothetical protein
LFELLDTYAHDSSVPHKVGMQSRNPRWMGKTKAVLARQVFQNSASNVQGFDLDEPDEDEEG